MKKLFYIILLLLSFVSCETKVEHPLSQEFEEVRALMQTDPEAALLKLQDFKNSATPNLSNLEYSILLAEALYKNYLPQSNFDDIKAIVDYIEKEKTTPNTTLLIPDYLRAKAHYYHAVGFSERDDIVGACEHYLKALEILSGIKNPDYEQTRFTSLTCNRLGDLFQSCGYSDLSLRKYKKALSYIEMINDTLTLANIFKVIGNTYYMLNVPDSALCYYNLSLKTSSHAGIRLDVEKPMAYILYEKGYKDSAYQILKDNILQIHDFNLLCSYYNALGELYVFDNEYNKAIGCFDTAFMSGQTVIKTMAAKKLSEIYDTIGDNVKKHYYSDFVLEYSVDRINMSVDIAKMQEVYDNYSRRKSLNGNNEMKHNLFVISIIIIIIVVVLLIYHMTSHKVYKDTIEEKNRIISDVKSENVNLEKKLTSAETKLNSKANRLLKAKNNITSVNKKLFYDSEISRRIFNKIKDLEEKGYKSTSLEVLTKDEQIMLLHSADEHLNNIITNLSVDYPNLDDIDKLCICLSILKINKTEMARLLGRNYKTIWRRCEKIRSMLPAVL